MRVVILGLCVAATLAGCGESEDDSPPVKIQPADDAADGTDGGTAETAAEDPRLPGEATDRCRDAPRVTEGRHLGTLRGRLSELGGACGQGGPDAFFRVEVPFRADVFVEAVGVGFEPRVGVLPAGCSNDWAHRTLACTQGVGEWLLDFAPGASLVVSVGADPDEPGLQLPAPAEGDDPLDFALDVVFRNVLGEGERCEPSTLGRCGTGTTCLVPSEPDAAAVAVCVPLQADTCAQALPLLLDPGTTFVQVPSNLPHTDAHAHSCTGAHRPDRVYELELGPSIGPREVVVRTSASGVGLAIRAPSCLPEDEWDCAAGSAEGIAGPTEVSAVIPADADDRVFVFVELVPHGASGPDPSGESGEGPGEEAPIPIEVVVSELPAGR